jgi:hypothetical protein
MLKYKVYVQLLLASTLLLFFCFRRIFSIAHNISPKKPVKPIKPIIIIRFASSSSTKTFQQQASPKQNKMLLVSKGSIRAIKPLGGGGRRAGCYWNNHATTTRLAVRPFLTAATPRKLETTTSSNDKHFLTSVSSSNTQSRSMSTSATTADNNNNNNNSKPLRVAIIGAGIAGLQAIRSLQAQKGRLEVTAVEASPTAGGLWKANYSNFGIQVSKQLFKFQDFPMTEASRGEFASGKNVQAYVEHMQMPSQFDSIQYQSYQSET